MSMAKYWVVILLWHGTVKANIFQILQINPSFFLFLKNKSLWSQINNRQFVVAKIMEVFLVEMIYTSLIKLTQIPTTIGIHLILTIIRNINKINKHIQNLQATQITIILE